MSIMTDRNGKVIHEGELIKIVDMLDVYDTVNFWTIFDCIKYGTFTDFILKHCVTNEIRIVSQKNIERTY